MKIVHYFLYLPALTGFVTGLITRKHIYFDQPLDWFGAQAYCRRNYVDLSTIDTPEELQRFKNQTGNQYFTQFHWIGLNKKPEDKNFTLWNDGTKVNNIQWYKNQPDGPTDQNCGLLYYNLVCDHYCNDILNFICFTWEPKLIVVQEEKTWDEALKHCRTHYTDLISFNSNIDLVLFNNVTKNIQTPDFWTGLRFHDGSWYWVNRDGLGSLFSLPPCPIQPFVCGALKTGANVLQNRDCKEKKPFVCYVY